MPDFSSGPDIRAAVDRAAERLGEHASAADVEREAEKILASQWRAMYGSSGSRAPCRITADTYVSACTSRLPATVRALVYDRVRRTGSSLRRIVTAWSHGRAPAPRLHVRLPDSAVLSAGHDQGIASLLIHTLERAALDAEIDVVEGPVFSVSTDADLQLLETLPDLLGRTKSVRPVLDIDDTSDEFMTDAMYAVVLAFLAPGTGPHGREFAVRTSSCVSFRFVTSTPSLTVTVTAGSGTDLTHAGREAFRVGRGALDELVAASSGDGERFRPGAVQIALSAEHAGAIARRISAGSVRTALMADVPRAARTDVVVDGYPLGLAPRNRLALTPDSDPIQLAARIRDRLAMHPAGRSLGDSVREASSPVILLSTPAATR